MILDKTIDTFTSNYIVGVISKYEFDCVNHQNLIQDKEDIVLISIHDKIDRIYPEEKLKGFFDYKQICFWDTESYYDGTNYPPITFEQGKELKDFILKNKDKKFLIHCTAGISRSAGVAYAIECLLEYDGIKRFHYTGGTGIINHKTDRYSPNLTVYDRIIGE